MIGACTTLLDAPAVDSSSSCTLSALGLIHQHGSSSLNFCSSLLSFIFSMLPKLTVHFHDLFGFWEFRSVDAGRQLVPTT